MAKPELLAPAGDLSALRAAVKRGADAVYLGVEAFNARAKATNFSTENLKDSVDFCHIFGVKVYITLNTMLKQTELDMAKNIILKCAKANVDAFIISDLALIDIIKKTTNIPIHLSTQTGICNLSGALFAQKLGVKRVVLARETSLEDIIKIKDGTTLEIEYFVQGALCAAFSGKCLLSSMIFNESGNRGRCLQPCRKLYQCNGKTGYLLSTSDLCMLPRLKDLANAGVSSFKIEGRMKSAEYVAESVTIYKKAIDSNFKFSSSNVDALKRVFNRGNFSEGYLDGQNNNIIYPQNQSNIGLNIGTIVKSDGKSSMIDTKFVLTPKDGIKVLDLSGKEIYGGFANGYKKGDKYIINVPGLKMGYKVNLTSDYALSENISKEPNKKLNISAKFYIDNENLARLNFKYKNNFSSVKSDDKIQPAQKIKTLKEEITDQICKLGNTYFKIENLNINYLDDYFIPKSVLNNLRRKAVNNLQESILNTYKKKIYDTFDNINNLCIIHKSINKSILIAVELQNIEQITPFIVNNSIIVYSPKEYKLEFAKQFITKCKQIRNSCEVFFKILPDATQNEVDMFKNIIFKCNFDGIYADNLYGIMLASDLKIKSFSGALLNIANEEAVNKINPNYFVSSVELDYTDLNYINFDNMFVYAYGFLPVMNLKYCVNKLIKGENCSNCTYKNGEFNYVDEKHFAFPIIRTKAINCYFDLLNAKIINISKKKYKSPMNLYLNMLQLDGSSAEKVLKSFLSGGIIEGECTTGHISRGVL